MTRAVIYRRQSQDRHRTELAVERQGTECERLCTIRSWTVTEVITDNSVSASKRGREGYSRLLQFMERREVDVVVILRIDRLMRLNDELETLIELSERTGVKVATVEGDIDLSTPQGRLIARVLVSVARAEVETKTARQKLANAQHAALGRPYGSVRAYGYTDHMYRDIEAYEAAVLREMANRIIGGQSLYDVTYWLNQSGHLTTNGKLWITRSVKRTLTHKVYVGIREYQGTEYQATWEPIFDLQTWERLQLAIKAREKNAGQVYSRKYLLTGLVVCGVCGKPLVGTTAHNNRMGRLHRVYHCRKQGYYFPQGGCGSIKRGAEALDHYIRELVLYRLDTPELGKLLSKQDDNGQLAELLRLRQLQRQRHDGLVDDYASGLLTRQELARAKQTAEVELLRIDSEIAALTAHSAVKLDVGQTLREAWDKNPLSWRQSLLALVIKEIRVLPTRKATGYYKVGDKVYRFNKDSIEIEWVA